MHVAHNVAMICKRCLVSGKVQGVFYRASTARRARELDVTGYAMNLADGRVEVLVYGEPENVLALCEWLWEGPPAAKVNDVEVYNAEITDIPEGFITR
jgi:acylphosphatase